MHPTGSGACKFRIIHTDATGGTANEQATTTTKQHNYSTPNISAHSNTKGKITMTLATNLAPQRLIEEMP